MSSSVPCSEAEEVLRRCEAREGPSFERCVFERRRANRCREEEVDRAEVAAAGPGAGKDKDKNEEDAAPEAPKKGFWAHIWDPENAEHKVETTGRVLHEAIPQVFSEEDMPRDKSRIATLLEEKVPRIFTEEGGPRKKTWLAETLEKIAPKIFCPDRPQDDDERRND